MPRSETSLLQQRRPNPNVEKALAAFEREMGGRGAVIEVLSHCPAVDENLRYVLGLLMDPEGEARSLAALCIDGDVNPGKLLELIRDGEMSRAQALSLRKVARLLPDVALDVMERALPRKARCSSCGGVPRNPLCIDCGGTGQVMTEPSLERQKTALELGGLLKKAPAVQIQNNQLMGQLAGDLREFQQKSDKALYEDVPVDAEVVGE